MTTKMSTHPNPSTRFPVTYTQSRTLQTLCQKHSLQTFPVSRSGHHKLLQSEKADTTNFCNLKKRTLQTIVVSKNGHYILLQSEKVDTTNYCSLKKRTLLTLQSQKADTTNFCSLSLTFVVYVRLLCSFVVYQ